MKRILLAIVLALLPSVAQAQLTNNLVAYWSLDEASGNAIDVHDDNDVTETSGTIDSAAGKVATCRDCERDDTEHFLIADNADLSTGNIDFTIAAWVNFETEPGAMALVSTLDPSGSISEYELYYEVDRLRFRVTPDGSTGALVSVAANTFGAISTGTWYFVVDEVGFWKRVLSSGERAFLYSAGNGRAYPMSPLRRLGGFNGGFDDGRGGFTR